MQVFKMKKKHWLEKLVLQSLICGIQTSSPSDLYTRARTSARARTHTCIFSGIYRLVSLLLLVLLCVFPGPGNEMTSADGRARLNATNLQPYRCCVRYCWNVLIYQWSAISYRLQHTSICFYATLFSTDIFNIIEQVLFLSSYLFFLE